MILKNGQKVADGSIEEITRKFLEGAAAAEANLEEVFFRATSDAPNAPDKAAAEPPPGAAEADAMRRRAPGVSGS